MAGAREDFAAALSTVEGFRGHEYMPADPQSGDAWAVVESWSWPDGYGGGAVCRWSVLLCLGTDVPAAERRVSSVHAAAVAALSEMSARVTEARPQITTFGDGRSVYCLVITTYREDD